MAPRLTAPPIALCLDLCMCTPDSSKGEGAGSSCADSLDESEGEGAGSSGTSTSDESKSESEEKGTPYNASSLATSRKRESFNWDWEHGFSLEWASLAKFEMWRQVEERTSSIKLIRSSTWTRVLFSWQQCFVCRRQDSRGPRKYQKKHPRRKRKVWNRKSSCSCYVIVKQYHHTSTILGCYIAKHDHKIREANIAFTYLAGTTQGQIKMMLTQKIDWDKIISCRNQKSWGAP